MRRSPSGRAALGVLVVVAGGLLGAGCSGSPAGPTSTACGLSKPVARAGPPASTANAESWAYPNADLANTRDALDSTISSADVSKLKPDWTFKLTGRAAASVHSTGSLAANPIVQAGVVYLQDLDSNVYALTLATGRLGSAARIGDI